MEKIRQRSLHGEAAQRIRDMINDGALAPGIRVPEKQLCEQFGISRTPLREALKVLASEGFVELLPNRGARITRLTRRTLEDTLQVTSALEGLSGELACQHASDAEIAAIRGLHNEMLVYYRRGDLSQYFVINKQIHEAIVAAARNKVLSDSYQNLNERVRRFRFSARMTPENWAIVVNEHEKIVTALEQRDAARLGELLRRHLRLKLNFAADTAAPEATDQTQPAPG
jgi:DNA-binding GntR family transcriptional regulator